MKPKPKPPPVRNCSTCWHCAGTPRESTLVSVPGSSAVMVTRLCRYSGLRVAITDQASCCIKWLAWPTLASIAQKANLNAATRIHANAEDNRQ